MVSKETVNQYIDMRDEAKEIKNTIEKLKTDIDRITKQINDLEANGTVKDKVYGGEGGWQGFTIEGFPTMEHRNKKNLLYTKKIKLSERVSTLEVLETEFAYKIDVSNSEDDLVSGVTRLQEPIPVEEAEELGHTIGR